MVFNCFYMFKQIIVIFSFFFFWVVWGGFLKPTVFHRTVTANLVWKLGWKCEVNTDSVKIRA